MDCKSNNHIRGVRSVAFILFDEHKSDTIYYMVTKVLYRKIVIAFAVLLLLCCGMFTSTAWGAIDPSLVGYDVYTGSGTNSAYSSGSLVQPPTASLEEGEVLVGKSIVYNMDTSTGSPLPDGTVTVTLSVWANTYTNTAGAICLPLVPMRGGVYVEITDDIGEFYIDGTLPAGLTLSGTTITWDITEQSASTILGAAPLTVSYTLTVVNPNAPPQPPYMMGYWYSTGTANAIFQPAGDNPYYYTMSETSYNEFTMSMNWNNGNGLNSGGIIDNASDQTIIFPKNISAQNMHAYNSDGTMNVNGQWNWWPQTSLTQNQAATEATATGTDYYTWQLQWNQATGPKTYVFTVKDFAGPGKDVQYEIEFPSGGGSQAFPGGKTIVSEEYFQKTYNSDQDDPFFWTGQEIDVPLDVFGEIMIEDPTITPETFDLTIQKAFGVNDAHEAWGVSDSTVFTAYIQNANGLYLAFSNNGGGNYSYLGMTIRRIPITFSVNTPAVLTGIPVTDATTALVQQIYSVAEDPTQLPSSVDITYSLDGGTPEESISIEPSANDETELTVINDFTRMPTEVLRLFKLFDGFPGDWGITSSTEFQVKINDITDPSNENYLLFVNPANEGNISDWPNLSSWPAHTLYCVGNDGGGGNDSSMWVFSDPYWQTRYEAGTATIINPISIYELKLLGLSNIWPGTYQIDELDFNGNLLSTSPANTWWQAYPRFMELTRMFPIGPQEQGVLYAGGVYQAFITNYFQHGEGNLSITKVVKGYPQDWGVNNSTKFNIKVKNMTDSTHLLFDPNIQADGTYYHVGFIDAAGNRVLEDFHWAGDLQNAIDELTVSVNSPLEISGIFTGNDNHYMIEETKIGNQSVQVIVDGKDISGDGPTGGITIDPVPFEALTVDAEIINTFNKQTGKGNGNGNNNGSGGKNSGINSVVGDVFNLILWVLLLAIAFTILIRDRIQRYHLNLISK